MAPCSAPARRRARRQVRHRMRRRVRHQAVPLALLAALALGAAPPQAGSAGQAAPAEEGTGGVSVAPGTVEPGGRLAMRVDACKGDTGLAYSAAFVKDVLLRPTEAGGLSGSARISPSAAPGTHTVTVDCDGQQGVAQGKFTVAGETSPSPSPSPASPSAPVRAGGGGAAEEGRQDSVGGSFGAGGAAVLGAGALAAFVAFLLRTRRSNGDG